MVFAGWGEGEKEVSSHEGAYAVDFAVSVRASGVVVVEGEAEVGVVFRPLCLVCTLAAGVAVYVIVVVVVVGGRLFRGRRIGREVHGSTHEVLCPGIRACDLDFLKAHDVRPAPAQETLWQRRSPGAGFAAASIVGREWCGVRGRRRWKERGDGFLIAGSSG